ELLAGEDRELAAIALRRLRADGLDLRPDTRAIVVERRGRTGIRLHVERGGSTGTVDGTHLLVAAGRRPDLDGLGLETAGIATTARGVRVDAHLRSSNRHVHAVGAAADRPEFLHAANDHAGIVLRALRSGPPAPA